MGCLITFHILISKGYIPTFLFVVFHRCFEWLYSFVGNSEDKQSVLISTGGGEQRGFYQVRVGTAAFNHGNATFVF